MGRGEAYTGCWWSNMMKRDHLEDPGIDGRMILRCIFREWHNTGCWWSNMMKRDHLQDPGIDGRMILTLWRRNFLLNFSTPCI
jgi:hypothetical protein